MGKEFDFHFGKQEHVPYLDRYLKLRNFYTDTMNPRFANGNGYSDLTIGKPCLRHDSTIADHRLRIFINEFDIYFEVQTPYESLRLSGRYEPENFPKIKDIDILLDIIARKVLDDLNLS